MNKFGTKIAFHDLWVKINEIILMKFLILFILFFSLNLYAQGWQVVGEMPNPVYGGKAIATDSLIYIIGGFSEKENSNLDLIQAYNPGTNTWYDAAKMNEKRSYFVADSFGDSILITGGVESFVPPVISSNIEFWNLNSQPVVYNNDTSLKRSFAAGNIVGNNLYLFGGTVPGSAAGYLAIYNIADAKIEKINPSIKGLPQIYMCSTVKDNKIFMFGGVITGLQKSIFIFDPGTNNFEKINSSLNIARAGAVAVTGPQGNIYIIGGFSETKYGLSSVEVLQSKNNEYETEDGPELNYARKDLMAAVFENSIYVFGGTDRDNLPVSQVERLQLSVTTVVNNQSSLPSSYKLLDNYPNPFNPSTSISFSIPVSGKATLKVYNMLGNLVKTITSGDFAPGNYTYLWNGEDENNNRVSSGIYIYRLTTTSFSASKKMVLLK